MKHLKHILFTLLAATALLLGSPAQAQAQNDLRISYVRSPFNLQMIVMKERQILEQHLAPLGVNVQWLEINSGAKQAQALASGDLDIGGVMNTTSVLMANGEGNPVKIIAAVARPTDVFAIVAAPNGITSISELRGKTIAGPKGTVLHQLLVAALAKEGMSINDVNFIQMDIPQAFAAMQSGNIDAALLAANFIINAQKENARILTTATGIVTPVLVMTTSDRFLQNHPDWVQATVAAHDQAWAWIQANPQEAIELGARVQNISLEDAQNLYNWSHFTQRLNASDIQSMEQDMQFMLDNEMMRNRIDIAPIVQPQAFENTNP